MKLRNRSSIHNPARSRVVNLPVPESLKNPLSELQLQMIEQLESQHKAKKKILYWKAKSHKEDENYYIQYNPLGPLPPPKYVKLCNQSADDDSLNKSVDHKDLKNSAYNQLSNITTKKINASYESNSLSDNKYEKQLGEYIMENENNLPYKRKYKPYTIRDYNNIKSTKYYELGGLGANIGTDIWNILHKKVERMNKYAQVASTINKNLKHNAKSLPPIGKIINIKDTAIIERIKRMKEYAEHVPKPELKKKIRNFYELDELNNMHDKYIEAIKKVH